jgi:putative Holliday junction resolvase
MGRLLGIDYGTKRIGLAVTDPLRLIASPLKTIKTGEFDAFVSEYLKTESIDAFIIGYPVQMNNKQSESVKYIKPFIRRLEKQFPSIPVHLVDERFTSKMALRSMIDGGVKKNDRKDKGLIDKTSAAIILRSFLDRKVN